MSTENFIVIFIWCISALINLLAAGCKLLCFLYSKKKKDLAYSLLFSIISTILLTYIVLFIVTLF